MPSRSNPAVQTYLYQLSYKVIHRESLLLSNITLDCSGGHRDPAEHQLYRGCHPQGTGFTLRHQRVEKGKGRRCFLLVKNVFIYKPVSSAGSEKAGIRGRSHSTAVSHPQGTGFTHGTKGLRKTAGDFSSKQFFLIYIRSVGVFSLFDLAHFHSVTVTKKKLSLDEMGLP